MLICPNCRVEYREGFTHCSDCDALLVHERALPGSSARPSDVQEERAPVGDPEKDPFCSFWKGTDPRLCAEISELLKEQSIPYKTVRRQDHLFNFNNQVPFEIGIPFSQFAKAEAALRDAYGDADAEESPVESNSPGLLGEEARTSKFVQTTNRSGGLVALFQKFKELGGELAQSAEPPEKHTVWDPGNWFPEDATAQVWQGEHNGFQEMFVSSLAENEIHSRWDDVAGRYSLYVCPQDEERAREIIRQIVEAAPPAE